MVGEYGGDHVDFRGGEFNGPIVAKGAFYQQVAAPTALNALPARAAGFTGRGGELDQLLRAFDPSRVGDGVPVLVAALSGLGGIGKTALAVEAAHEACGRGWFPGGLLFLDLHGYDDDPVTGEQALETLLRGLGVEPEHIPVRGDERGALYRSVLAERGAVLVVADNASAPDQVRPLIPGEVRHRLLVTSRGKLPQLGARLLALDELSPGEAYELLDRALRIADPGDSRVIDEAEAAVQVASRCGHLPLALQIAAALLALDEDKAVAELALELAELSDRLAHLDDGERSVRAALDLSYRRLPADQARLLRLISLAPGSQVTIEAVTALAGEETRPIRTLDVLARTHLVGRGSGRGWWRLHDLVRAYGLGLVAGDARLREEGERARERLLGFYLRWAGAADDRLRWLPGKPEPERFGDRAQALAWLDGERAGLVGAVQWAEEERHAGQALTLAGCLPVYLHWRRYFDDAIAVARAMREGTHRAGHREGEAVAWSNLGIALRAAGRLGEAIEAHTWARDLFQATGDHHGEAEAWGNLGFALQEAGRTGQAIDALTHARKMLRATGGDHHREGVVWNNLGLALGEAGRTGAAIDALFQARKLFQAAGDRHGEGTAWNNLGLALRRAGRMEEAIEAYGKDLEICREFEDWYGIGATLSNLANAHAGLGRPAEARAYHLQAADAFTQANASTEAAEARSQAERLTP